MWQKYKHFYSLYRLKREWTQWFLWHLLLLWIHKEKFSQHRNNKTILRLQKQKNKSLREIAGISGLDKLSGWAGQKKKITKNRKAWMSTEHNSSGWSQDEKQTKPNQKKKTFTTSSQVKNTRQGADISLSTSSTSQKKIQSVCDEVQILLFKKRKTRLDHDPKRAAIACRTRWRRRDSWARTASNGRRVTRVKRCCDGNRWINSEAYGKHVA